MVFDSGAKSILHFIKISFKYKKTKINKTPILREGIIWLGHTLTNNIQKYWRFVSLTLIYKYHRITRKLNNYCSDVRSARQPFIKLWIILGLKWWTKDIVTETRQPAILKSYIPQKYPDSLINLVFNLFMDLIETAKIIWSCKIDKDARLWSIFMSV